MIDQLYPIQPQGISSPTAPRRLPGGWLWTTRGLWVAIFLVMLVLNGAAIVAQVQRNASGIGGGAAGLRATRNEFGAWVLTVDDLGPAAHAGIEMYAVLLAIDDVELTADDAYRQVNRQLYGNIGDPMTLTVQARDGTVREVTIELVAEDLLHIWRRFRVPLDLTGPYMPALEAFLLAGYLLTSLLIFWRRSDDWLALYLTVTLVLITPQLSYAWYYLGQTAAYWEMAFRVLVAVAVALTLPNFYLLPNGQFVPRWTIVLAVIWVVWSMATELFPNLPFSIYGTPGATQLLVWLGWFATGMLAQVYRYRYDATPTEQQQIKWVAFGLTVAVFVNLGWTLAFELFPALSQVGQPHQLMWWVGRPIYVVGMMTLPVAFGIAVFRYRLWDIDDLINRTLVYGTLTAVIVGIYVLVVAVFDALFSTEGQVISQIIALTLDLIIFEPLRDRLQAGVDRLMFGESEDLPTVIARLGQALAAVKESDEVLPTIVATLADVLELPFVAIALIDGESFRVTASSGTYTPAHFSVPLVYQRQTVGQLLLSAREMGEIFKPNEWEVIENAAYHVSAAVHDCLLAQELQRRQANPARGDG